MDITRNLFYWFRGPSAKGTSDRQLENNMTKSLVTVLEQCDRNVVLRRFLRLVGLKHSDNVAFSLQRKPVVASAAGKRLILAITGGESDIQEHEGGLYDGRPDAWILGPTWTILVESKIGSKVNTPQLHAHAKAAGWEPKSYTIQSRSWSELHRIFRTAQRQFTRGDRVSRLLLSQWLTYMEHQNMTDFEKLEAIDFDFHSLSEDQRRPLLRTMKRRMRSFAKLVSKAPAIKRVAAMYDEKHVDDWKYGEPSTKARGGWFNIGGDPSPQRWHLTVFPRPEGLEVTVLNSRNHLTNRLCRVPEALREVVAMARKSPDLYIGCRRAWYFNPKSSYKGQRIIRTDDPLVVKPGVLDAGSINDCAAMLETTLRKLLKGKKWRTELQIRQEIPRAKLQGITAEKQVAMVAKSCDALGKILACLMATESGQKA